MKQAHWQASITTDRGNTETTSCHAYRREAVAVLRQHLQSRPEDKDLVRAALADLNGDGFAPERGDPAETIGTGPLIVVAGVSYMVIGCNGDACEYELENERTYGAFNGHRMTARLKRHPRTGALIYDYDGNPQYSQVDAWHSDECPCMDPEDGDGGADYDGVQRWEFSGDY